MEILIVSTRETWEEEGCLDDEYEEDVYLRLLEGMAAAGLPDWELSESHFEFPDTLTPTQVREQLSAQPGFAHEPSFESSFLSLGCPPA